MQKFLFEINEILSKKKKKQYKNGFEFNVRFIQKKKDKF